jgi:hypothetical protein
MFVKILLVVSGVLLVGCGGGGSGQDNPSSTSGLSSNYNGKTEKVIISEDNSIKFIRAINYFKNFDLSDFPTEGNGIVSDKHINENTKLGYVIYNYNNYDFDKKAIVNGNIRVDILEIKENTNNIVIKNKMKVNLLFNTVENNISFNIVMHGTNTIDTDGETTESNSFIDKYTIYDEKHNEHIEILDFTTQQSKLYIESEGYVIIDANSNDPILYGENGSKLKLVFKPEEALYETRYHDPSNPNDGKAESYQEKIYEPKKGQGVIENTINGIKKPDLYFVNYQVSKYEPAKFYENYGKPQLLEYAFFTWHTKYKLLNEDANNTKINIEWFVNGKKIKTNIMYELPFGSYKEGDTIKVVITATNGDMIVKQEQLLEGYDTNYGVNFGADAVDSFDITYRTNNLEFDLDLLAHEYFNSINLEESEFSWYVDDGGSHNGSYKIVNHTEYNKIPHIKSDQYGMLHETLYLRIYRENDIKVVSFNITLLRGNSGISIDSSSGDIVRSIEEANLTNDAGYITTKKVTHLDMDNNGLDDIVYTSETDNRYFLNISYQESKREFSFEKVESNGILYLGDFDGNGIKEALMFSDTQNASQVISLEKGNLHVVKEINLTNDMNILNLQSTADMNNDEKDDLIVANNEEKKLYIYENIDDLTQKRLVGASVCRGIQAIKDINNDGLKDIICKPIKKEIYDDSTDLYSSLLVINYFTQESDATFSLKTRKYSLTKDDSFSNVARTRVYGAIMLDDTNMVISTADKAGYTLYICDLSSNSLKPKSKTATNSEGISAFLVPKDINHDGKIDLLSYRNYGQGELNVFYQVDNFSFDADYRVEMNTYNQLTDRFFSNAFLDDIDKDGTLEILTVNGENKFSYINLK